MKNKLFCWGIVAVLLVMFVPCYVQAGGDVQITCEPGVRIWIDGRFQGKTNVEDVGMFLENLPAGSHIVKAAKKGFKPITRKFFLKEGETVEIELHFSSMAASGRTRKTFVAKRIRGSKGQPRRKGFVNNLGMRFVYIAPGTFMMGSPPDEVGRGSDEVQHQVTITQGFFLQVTEVTQGQWRAVMKNNPSKFKECGEDCPVENVSWNECQTFIKRLNAMGQGKYRLPTEAEWEYACRAGSTTRFHFSEMDHGLGEYAWYWDNSGGWPHSVALKKPNAWGLYDMHGNVWEWCQDWYDKYPSRPVTNPRGPSDGSYRVIRGGGWNSNLKICRSAQRRSELPENRHTNLGLRLVRIP